MKKRTTFIAIMLLTPLLLLWSCASHKMPVSTKIDSEYYASGDTYIALLNDSYIFMRMEIGKTTYYRQYLYEDKLIEIGEIPNFFLSTKGAAVLENCVYFMAAIYEDDKIQTTLFQINLENNSLSAVTYDELCNFDAYTFSFGKKIAIAKYYYEGDMIRSCVELVDPTTQEIRTVYSENMNNKTLEGSIILMACGSDNSDCLVTLNDSGQGLDQSPITKLIIYDEDYKINEVFSIDSVHDYIMSSRVNQLRVENDYVFMSNYSNRSILGRIENGEIIPILQQQELEIAGKSDYLVLFTRGTNLILLLDLDTGVVNQISIPLDDDYSIKCVLSDNNKVLVVLKKDGDVDRVFLTDLEELIRQDTVIE